MAEKDIIKVIAEVERIRYYKNEWGIIECSIDPKKIKEGNPKLDKNGMAIFKGVMPQLQEKNIYNITAEYVDDAKWGGQYNILSIFTALDFGTGDPEGQKKFLSSIYTPLQVTNMYEALDNPFKALKDKDVSSLVKIKGCGMDTADRWIRKFERHIGEAKIYTELEEYNLTTNMIKKLMDRYKSPELVIEKVKNNPYVLCNEVKGIGWKTADKIALEGGIGEFSTKRIAAYMVHYLDESGENGCSWITPDELMGAILEGIGEEVPDANVTEAIHELGDELWWNEDKSKIGLRRYFNIEQKIAEELIRIRDAESNIVYKDWEDTIKHLEHKQGWEYTDEQKSGVKTVLDNNITVVTGLAGCVDCDTEYFNGTEWKKISEYQKGEKVLQYNTDGTAELVTPERYIKQPSECLYHFETKYGLDQTLSLEHNVVYVTSKGNLYSQPFSVIKERQENKGFFGKFITSFKYSGEGINLTDDEIRIMVAIMADGHFNEKTKNTNSSIYKQVRINLKKDRKKQRLEKLLNNLCLDYIKVDSTIEDFHTYYFESPLLEKHFPQDWYQCNLHQLQIIFEEVLYWDSNYKKKNCFSTTSKSDADFIQFVFSALGYRATILLQDRVGQTYKINDKEYIRQSKEYEVTYTKRNLIEMCHDHREDHTMTPIVPVKPSDGYEYCFTVPSHMLVLRRNDKIFVTGNCGKSTLVSAMIEVLRSYSYVQCALSGRASSRMSEITGQEGYTIHRLLGYPLGDKQGFEYHDENPLPYNIYILDEISMVDAYLFYYLLRAIPNGAKLVCLGDPGQLESIGCGNIAHDMINSEEIPTVTLTKIHRQAAKSAIITESIKIRNGQQIINKDWVGEDIRGELQDLHIDCFSDKTNTYYKIVQSFVSLMANKDFNIMETQIIVPVKNNGSACTYELNNSIQEMYNPEDRSKKEHSGFSNGKPYILREGDKVMNVVNNYKTSPPIYNGNIGIIRYIDYDEDMDEEIMLIDFKGIGEVKVPKESWNNIELGYAITVHKSQGDQANHIIFGLDFTSYSLLSREMIYTGITRAKKKCDLIAQTGALRMAISKEGVSKKQTHLQQCLYDVAHPKIIF